MNDIIKKKLFVVFGCIILLSVSIYGYRITETRKRVQENGIVKKAKVDRISSKRKGSLYVRIDDTVYDAGDYLSQYNCNVGDSIEVYHLDNVKYVVPKIRGSFLGYFVLEITSFCIGILLLILFPFLKEKANKINSEQLIWPKDKGIDSKTLDRYFSTLMKNPNFMLKLDTSSVSLLNQKIVAIFNEAPSETIDYLSTLLKRQDFKLDYIYFGLIDSDLFKDKFFVIEFKKVFSDYLKNPSSYYEQIFQTFILSSHFDTNEKIRREILNWIELSFSKLNSKSVDRLKKIIKTCT